ncbi:MAG: DNA alkylation repair protein [Clostridiales bacterium]|nr:DNA alkylation repair protein [Clostridiales bacterium]
MEIVTKELFAHRDEEYGKFTSKLMPTVNADTVIGVRTPQLRLLAKWAIKCGYAEQFLSELPHKYFEENNLHAFIIENIKDYDECLEYVNVFLPFVDNWATCDQMSPKVFKGKLQLLGSIKEWMASEHTYVVRFGIGMLMKYFLDNNFKPEYLDLVAEVKSDEYYIKMMVAWFFATALTKQYEATLPYIEQYKLEKWTHNKAIQKAVESYRISDERKALLKQLKI